MRVLIVADRRFHGNRFLGDLEYLAHLIFRHFHLDREFIRRRFAAHFLQHLARDAVELVDGLDHMHRNADGACLVRNRARDRLANPPGRVSRELVTAAVFEFVHGVHQADVAFLDQVEELQAAVGVFLGDGNHQAQVGLDHLFLGAACFGLADGHLAVNFLEFLNGKVRFFFDAGQRVLVWFSGKLLMKSLRGMPALATHRFMISRSCMRMVSTRRRRLLVSMSFMRGVSFNCMSASTSCLRTRMVLLCAVPCLRMALTALSCSFFSCAKRRAASSGSGPVSAGFDSASASLSSSSVSLPLAALVLAGASSSSATSGSASGSSAAASTAAGGSGGLGAAMAAASAFGSMKPVMMSESLLRPSATPAYSESSSAEVAG